MSERSEVMEQHAVRDVSPAYRAVSAELPVDDVAPGYKRTEAGEIPEDWQALPAREIGAFKGGSGFPLKTQGDKAGEYPFFKVSDMNTEGNEIFMTTANHHISEETRSRLGATAFPRDSIVFAKVGAAVFLERKKYSVNLAVLTTIWLRLFSIRTAQMCVICTLCFSAKSWELWLLQLPFQP